MALAHAQPLDVIDVRPLGPALRAAVTTSLLKTPSLQLMRLVLAAGQGLPEHSVADSKALGMAFGDAWTYAPAPEASAFTVRYWPATWWCWTAVNGMT